MSEVTDLVVIEKANAITVFQSADQIEEILQKVEREVMSFVVTNGAIVLHTQRLKSDPGGNLLS